MSVENLYGPQTEMAIQNFPFSTFRFARPFLKALASIKHAAAIVNADLGILPASFAASITDAAQAVEEGKYDDQFPLDVFQTGSGTSINMNMNEVIATLASKTLGTPVHPNDHVNLGQSSNDVIPSTIHISALAEITIRLIPALVDLRSTIAARAQALDHVVKTGRTHLMDAVPMRMSQELSGWSAQIELAEERLRSVRLRLAELAIGGTAIGTGLNTHPEFGDRVAQHLADKTKLPLRVSRNRFASISSQDTALELSAHLRGLAVALLKICNDLRWMNSGPVSGLSEISLPTLQPGSSMMPGKVNPVIPEAVAMICAQVIGNDTAIMMGAQSGNFQLNTMLPLIAWNLLWNIEALSRAVESLGEKAIATFSVDEERLARLASRNPILATALAPRIGYDQSTVIAREAIATGKPVADIAREKTSLSDAELVDLLDPRKLT
jgi:fumarate hydratase class II